MFPREVLAAVKSWAGVDCVSSVTIDDIFGYHRHVLEVTSWGLDGEPEEYGLYLPSLT